MDMGFFSKVKKFWGETPEEQGYKKAKMPEALQPEPEQGPDGEPTAKQASQQTPPASEPVRGAAPEPPATPATAPEAAEAKAGFEPWQQELLLALRGAEPRLSEWLNHVLSGVDKAGPELWQRLEFFFDALEAPKEESRDFIERFRKWLENMEYEQVEEFRSELQYRLALALDLEDEEDERSRLMVKLSDGLSKTKEKISRQIDGLLAAHDTLDESFWEGLEEILITADVGFDATIKLTDKLKEAARRENITDTEDFRAIMREELAQVFTPPKRISMVNPPEVVLMVGVNGVGKTTTIAKLAFREQMRGRKVLIAAGDTFRAAAIEQLQIWSERTGAGFFAKAAKSDPAAVAYEAVDKAIRDNRDVIFVDTAGRLHTKRDLMDELRKIKSVLGKKHPGAPHRVILVLDATTGQNALSQTKLFDEAVGVDEIVLTKLDGTAKGGIVAAIAIEFGKPITFIGLGEKMEDLRPFDGGDFAEALLGKAEEAA
jgi:fused signal recognition particle receptor